MRNDRGLEIFLVLLILLCAGLLICVSVHTSSAQAALPRMEPLTATFTADNDSIKAYILIDPDTSLQYIVTDKGGITPRLHN